MGHIYFFIPQVGVAGRAMTYKCVIMQVLQLESSGNTIITNTLKVCKLCDERKVDR